MWRESLAFEEQTVVQGNKRSLKTKKKQFIKITNNKKS